MNDTLTPAALALADAQAARAANEKAITTLKAERERLQEAEAEARASIARGESSRRILKALSQNVGDAAALLPAIESLEAQRPDLIQAVNRAIGEQWAEQIRALTPEGSSSAIGAIRDNLATTIREAVDQARAEADLLAEDTGRLLDQARQLARARALPQGASYNPSTGLTIDGVAFGVAMTNDLATQVGRQLDREHARQRQAAAWSHARVSDQN